MKTLLVPTDLSKAADAAINFAIGFAQKEKAEIVLLHVFRLHVVFSGEPGAVKPKIELEEEQAINKSLESQCKRIVHSKKVRCRYISTTGMVVDEIIKAAEKVKPDFIILGTKGATGTKRVIIGSNAATVIEKSKYPVIAVPENAEFRPIKRITYAADYQQADISAIRKLAEIAKPFRAAINVLHIASGELTDIAEEELLKKYVSKISEKINYNNISFQLAHGKNTEKELEKYVIENSPDLLAMSTVHRSFLEKLFGRSVTKQMVYHADVPLLAFHHKKEAAVFI